MNAHRGTAVALLTGLGFVIGAILTPVLVFGVWLLLTPDYDGGRQGLGTLIVVGAVLVAALYCTVFLLVRSRTGHRIPDEDR
jgi:MFS family permease